MNHQQQETQLVSLSIHESAIARQIESAEARVYSRCPKYDPENIYWKRVDILLKKQEDVTNDMGNYTKYIREENSKNENDKSIELRDFLKQPSPQKKGSKRSFEDMTEYTTISAIDDDTDDGLVVTIKTTEEV